MGRQIDAHLLEGVVFQHSVATINGAIKGKLLENEILIQQAANNSKEQFSNSPDLKLALMNAIMGAFEAHTSMSTQALGSEQVREGLKEILLGPAQLYETLRTKTIPLPRM